MKNPHRINESDIFIFVCVAVDTISAARAITLRECECVCVLCTHLWLLEKWKMNKGTELLSAITQREDITPKSSGGSIQLKASH